MASHSSTTPSNQTKRLSFNNYTGGNASLLLEKAKAGIRRSTPDSEALASSDEEQDQHHQLHSVGTQHGPRPTRRSSWLNDFQQGPQRKTSTSGSATFSPSSSHPTTPVADQSTWTSSMAPSVGPTASRVHSSSNSFPWGSTIWNSDTQKGPPSRLTEVLPSPTTVLPPKSASFQFEEPLLSPRMIRDTAAESAIPFAIPLHPTPKTYRSQSYSVGQLDPESIGAIPSNIGYPAPNGRNRAGSSYAGLQHRPSRPSMLGDFSHDPSVLGQLREVDDDDESSTGSEVGVQLSDTQARTIEQLAMENAFLRQAAANQLQSTRSIDPTLQTSSKANHFGTRTNGRTLQHVDVRVAEGRDQSRDEMNGFSISQAFDQYNSVGRRFSEHNANTGSQFSIIGTPENRKLESVKKGQWQSSLGFGGIAELPQSRRHSFADVPTRHGSISSAGEPQNIFGSVRDGTVVPEDSRGHSGYVEGLARPSQGDSGEYAHFRSRHSLEEQALELEHLRNRNFAASYFSNTDPSIRNPELYRPSNSPPFSQQVYPMQAQYNRQQHLGHPQSHPAQLLSMVTFKACRAEVYYVQEGTGLQVKAGDLVIVEADRGTDLGTVAHHNISWSMAKELKDHYVEEHSRWLMMFSRNGQNGSAATMNPNVSASSTNATQVGAVGGMGSPGQVTAQDQQSIELKPKMIKRLAQAHEIQTLRDKEGNEAKAKRVCQQKVVEHRLSMEILDAEFQMDWKKLTFYYFADSYINFNSLVTDLFKIYKTRIWMSAINPASFVTPAPALQLVPGMGQGIITSDRDSLENRVGKEHNGFAPSNLSQIPQGAFGHVWNTGIDATVPTSIIPGSYPHFYNSQNGDSQQINPNMSDYGRGFQPTGRSQSPFGYQGNGAIRMQSSNYSYADLKNVANRQTYANSGNDWTTAFHGLSLGS